MNDELFFALESDISSPHASNLGGCWRNYVRNLWEFRPISMTRDRRRADSCGASNRNPGDH